MTHQQIKNALIQAAKSNLCDDTKFDIVVGAGVWLLENMDNLTLAQAEEIDFLCDEVQK